ncbi:hypothetical protein DMA11_00790 [Marinilabiliaceae bacterium JC017]|nr:hypothetical protein DMA11_00790 [Marinilabiliaceae bacterium JC017]
MVKLLLVGLPQEFQTFSKVQNFGKGVCSIFRVANAIMKLKCYYYQQLFFGLSVASAFCTMNVSGRQKELKVTN